MADFVTNLPGAVSQWDEGPQLDEIAPANKPSHTTGLIALSVGGNNMGFPFVMPACVEGFLHGTSDRGCLAEISKEQKPGTQLLQQGGTILLNTQDNSYTFCDKKCASHYSSLDKRFKGYPLQVVTVPSLAGLYGMVHQRAPQAEIRVLVYPNLFPASPPASCTLASFFKIKYTIDQKEMTAVNQAGAVLDGIITKAVQTASNQGIDIQASMPGQTSQVTRSAPHPRGSTGSTCVTRSTASTPTRRASSSSPASSRPSRNERFQARPEPR